MPRLRILHLVDFYHPFIGGMERHVRALAAETARRGHEVSVLTAQLPDTAADESDGAVRVRRVPLSLARLPGAHRSSAAPFAPPIPDPALTRALARAVREDQPDVIHTHGWSTYS